MANPDQYKGHASAARDSRVFLSGLKGCTPAKTAGCPSSTVPAPSSSESRAGSIPAKSPGFNSPRRPAESNFPRPIRSTETKPQSELEQRFEMMRNPQPQVRAALKSPTELLRDRLDLSPKKRAYERVRVFIPPRSMPGECILPAPNRLIAAFARGDVCARTERGRPSWWCALDQVVVFDGMEAIESKDATVFRTRSSKGLRVAKRKSDLERINIPLECTHCWEILGRKKWIYDVRVCKRAVCWDCRERCRWIMEQEMTKCEDQDEVRRVRPDSVLQEQMED
ncbi:uncharacterized protein EI97DRAFT_437135 [Westerdykella ornata]|uniref:Uncharacterized protein n=1 Tax=Westerdykella ornata TaxID=318751 RepID=A0A6A6JAM8_WESOR|nr:uncharacterized protein EI97DRAFT_437135 [Westerdykella ornata]KAF2272249.1 hypothetical protein EI97DRAFT_437135 [Westerdykella ornata]